MRNNVFEKWNNMRKELKIWLQQWVMRNVIKMIYKILFGLKERKTLSQQF